MKILIAENELDLREIYALFLEMQLAATAITVPSGEAAILALKKAAADQAPFDLVLSDFNMPHGNGETLHRYAAQHHPDLAFIFLSAEDPTSIPYLKTAKYTAFIQKPDVLPQLKALIAKLFPERPASKSPYCRVHTETLLRGSPLSFDLYLKLGPEKFVKVISSGDLFDQTQAARFDAKNIQYLYITQEASSAFLHALTENLSLASQKEGTSNTDVAALLRINHQTLTAISDVTQTFGFTEEAQELTHAAVERTVKAVAADPAVATLFSNLMSFRESYFATHSTALAYISCGIASLLGWQSPGTFYKLTLASFLHDMSLGNSPLAEYASFQELESGPHGDLASRSRFLGHPDAAAALAKKMKAAPMDVSLVIAQHHERPDGSGFPNGSRHDEISPLSTVFIISHEILNYRLRTGEEINAAEFIDFLTSKSPAYKEGGFKDVTQALIHAAAKFGF